VSDPIVELSDVCVGVEGTTVLEDVSLEVSQDDYLAILGPNGGGKTTLLRVILGLVAPSSGEAEVFGRKPAEGRRHIGYLPQQARFDLSFPIRVRDVVLMGRYRRVLRGYSEEDHAASVAALDRVGMLPLADRQIGQLSGGQIQRVFLARAVARDPRLLLLDEPTASIDPETQQSFYGLLSEIRGQMAVVLVTHDVGVVSAHIDSVACLNRRLFYHGAREGALGVLDDVYKCPVELVAHGVPHRVLKTHVHDD